MSNVQPSDFKISNVQVRNRVILVLEKRRRDGNVTNKKSVWWTINSRLVRRNFFYSLAATLVLPEPLSSFKFWHKSLNSRPPQVKIVKCPISRDNHSQISNIQSCHLVKYPLSLISFTVGPSIVSWSRFGDQNWSKKLQSWPTTK